MANYPDTFGWDTVFAVSIDRVNIALTKVAASPTYTIDTPIQGGTASANWRFQNWRITDTPGGDQLEVTMDFGPGSTLSTPQTGEVALDQPAAWSCRVRFAAHFDEIDPLTRKLRARNRTGGAWAKVEVVPGYSDAPFGVVSVLQLLAQKWFDEDTSAVELFAQEFATVDLGKQIGSGPLAFIRPVQVGYAGGLMANGVTKAIGILAMTSAGKSPAAATLQLSPYTIPPGAKAGFVVSRELVLGNMIVPACAGAFSADGGSGNIENFEVTLNDSGALRVRNTADLSFKHELDGVQRAAKLDAHALEVTLDGDSLLMKLTPMNVATQYDGLSLDATIEETLKLSLIDNPAQPGGKLFVFNSVQSTPPKVVSKSETWVKVAEGVGITLALVLTGALAVVSFKGTLMTKIGLTATSAKIWARVIAVLVGAAGSIGALTPQWILEALEGDTHSIPDFGIFLTASISGISWPGGMQAVFVAEQAQFANGMLVTVDPRF